MSSPKTVAESMLDDLNRINRSLDELKTKGLPMSFILIYLNKRTHLPQKQIQSVLDGLRELNREVQPRPTTPPGGGR